MRCALVLLVSGLTACSNMAIEGDIVDVTGTPIVGANISAVGAPTCMTTTDEAGHFELVCAPAVYTVNIGAAGYISETLDNFDASERQRYPVGRKVLIKIPIEEGLLKFDGQSYKSMEPGVVVKRAGGKGVSAYRHYCLEEDHDNPVNRMPKGAVAFFDNESDGWRPFRLDTEGCAYRMSPTTESRWGVDYAEKAEFETKVVEQGKEIVLITFEPGAYFIADWERGHFTKVRNDQGETIGYSGFYVEVK